MKKSILIVFIFLFSFYSKIFAWDSNSALYMPLQVGNVWVYYSSGSGYMYYCHWLNRYKVTGIVDTLGHRYYVIEWKRYHIDGDTIHNCSVDLNILRIDSTTMNITKPIEYCSRNEMLIDSLSAKKGDTSWVCRQTNYSSACTDTLSYFMFNSNFRTKRFSRFLPPEGIDGSVYAQNIGIVRQWHYRPQSYCDDTLIGCLINGILYGDTNTIVGINEITNIAPQSFSLSQSYPNPFNPGTKIKFSLPNSSKGGAMQTKLVIYDALGKELSVLVNEQLNAGTYEVDWDGTSFPSGVYFYQLSIGSEQLATKKMVLIK